MHACSESEFFSLTFCYWLSTIETPLIFAKDTLSFVFVTHFFSLIGLSPRLGPTPPTSMKQSGTYM